MPGIFQSLEKLQELLGRKPGLLEDALLQQGWRNIFVVNRNGYVKIGARAV
jgi:hypothetical protein